MIFGLIFAPRAEAHRPGLSVAQIGDGEVVVVFAAPELAGWPIEETRARIGEKLVISAGKPCVIGTFTDRAVENDGVEFRAPLSCPASGEWTFTAGYLADFGTGHRQYLEAYGRPIGVLSASSPSLAFHGETSGRGAVAMEFGKLGVEHIFKGYDHLAFLFGLLLVARSLPEMLKIATGFTVAHSVTLSLAATGTFALPSAIVEPLIAASIVYVGVENLWKPPPSRRLAVTFGLGLIHGFGFAGLLGEIGIPENALWIALGSFNLGVEIGQAAIILCVLPVLLALRRVEGWEEKGVPALSVVVGLAGVGWLVQRLAGF